MRPRAGEISSILKEEIQNIDHPATASKTGTVLSIGDGIARIHGLSHAMAGERLEINARSGDTLAGLVLTLERDTVSAAIFGDALAVEEGDTVTCTGRLLDVPVGEALLGRVVNALGILIDDKGPIVSAHRGRVERRAPGLARRGLVREPLITGIKIIDACVPLGRGQSQVLLGDRRTGKTAIAIDTILHQKGQGIFCIYVAIGQRLSAVRRIVEQLEAGGAMEHTTVVVATANEAAPARYLAPFTGMALGEYFRDTGRHALCVIDDLSKHAIAYREISLLLGHLPGPEDYPVDIISVHGRVLDRAGTLADRDGPGAGGSLTALAVVETQGGEVSAYLPDSIAGITDGRIVLDAALFSAGVRPAVHVGASHSHVGKMAQGQALWRLTRWKSMAGYLRDHLTRRRSMIEITRLVPDLDAWTRAQIDHGARLVEIMKQGESAPLPLEKQILLLFAGIHRLLEDVPVSDLQRFEAELYAFVESKHAGLLPDLLAAPRLDKPIEDRMRAAIADFKEQLWPKLPRTD